MPAAATPPAAEAPTTTTAADAATSQAETTDDGIAEIVVFGLRQSLVNATEAKRDATAFTDSIFADDIGKLPSNNIAETLNRIPGIQLTRDGTGEGTKVSVRGLGPSFTRVLLNNTQIGVASDGGPDGGDGNREVDLDLFPTELFTRLDVAKTPTASQLEGGIAGVINMRNARPFDNPGQHFNYVAQGGYAQVSESVRPRLALIGSNTWDHFGVLVGVAATRTRLRTDAFETLGWTDGCLTDAPASCGAGNNNFRYAVNAPNNVNGLTPGQPLDLEALSGLSSAQLDSALIPRLGRYALLDGERDRLSGIVALQYQPSDDLNLNLDVFYAKAKRDFTRISSNWSVRNSSPSTTGGMVPIDLTVEDNVVTSGTFANSRFFVEARPIKDDLDFYNLNPSMMLRLNDFTVLDAQVNYGKSEFFREAPSFLFDTPAQSGIDVSYVNNGGIPSITPNADLGDPNLGWVWNRVNIQNLRRETENLGGRFDFTFGERTENVRVGAAYDDNQRRTTAYDNSIAYQAYVCGSPCTGGAGTGLPNAQLAQYLNRGPGGPFSNTLPGSLSYSSFVVPDFDALKQATNYDFYNRNAPLSLASSQNTPSGYVREKTLGTYAEVNAKTQLVERDVNINAGFRYVHTEQLVEGPASVAGQIQFFSETTTYEEFLPTFNATLDATDKLKLRLAGSRTMTRANPSSMLPGVTFGDPSAQTANSGNPGLSPYASTNVDIGGEYYTGDEGYVGVTFFNKAVDGFTLTQQTTVPFSSLGIDFDSLTSQQQQALNDRGGPGAATVNLTRPVNVNQTLTLRGTELTWLQPLDILLEGLGFQANYTQISQKSSSGAPAVPGISPNSYNLTGYYENYGWSTRVTWTHTDGGIAANGPQNGLPLDMNYDEQDRIDMNISYLLPFFNQQQRITLDAFNITNEIQRTTIGPDSMPYSVFAPGYTVILGMRGSF